MLSTLFLPPQPITFWFVLLVFFYVCVSVRVHIDILLFSLLSYRIYVRVPMRAHRVLGEKTILKETNLLLNLRSTPC